MSGFAQTTRNGTRPAVATSPWPGPTTRGGRVLSGSFAAVHPTAAQLGHSVQGGAPGHHIDDDEQSAQGTGTVSVRRASGRAANVLGGVFYVVTALVALAGATTAATGWLGWGLVPSVAAVAVVELGGIALAARADFRRQLGEHALSARVLSAAVAVFAVAFQWFGHADHRQGAFFSGVSAIAYGTWLINSADRRRDHLRAAGKLPPTPPVYGAARWVQHPWLTRRARALALADPTLGLFGSVAAAQEDMCRERRQRSIATVLHRRVRASVDSTTADIATAVYDLDEIARRLAAGADYDGLTALIAADLVPAQLAHPGRRPAENPQERPKSAGGAGAPAVSGRRAPTATRVARAVARMPDASPAAIAARAGVSESTARRYLRHQDDAD